MNTKSILASKTIWGVVIGALPTLLGLFGQRPQTLYVFALATTL